MSWPRIRQNQAYIYSSIRYYKLVLPLERIYCAKYIQILLYFFDPRFSGSQFQDLDIEVYLIKIANYVPIGDWRNNEQQKTLMIEHLREDIIFM